MIGNQWETYLDEEMKKPYFSELMRKIEEEREDHQIYPEQKNVFRAFDLTPPENVKTVILGQDPYHGRGQANGLCFSVSDGIKKLPSLVNIFKEIKDEYGYDIPESGSLDPWAMRGVLLLNTILTVRDGEPLSHKGYGWERFTDEVIRVLDSLARLIVFMLWGRQAQEKAGMLTNPAHLTLKAAHPSPFSVHRGFFGCGHFRECNRFLEENHIVPIDWKLQ